MFEKIVYENSTSLILSKFIALYMNFHSKILDRYFIRHFPSTVEIPPCL